MDLPVGAVIRRRRRAGGWSTRGFAAEVPCSQSYVSHVERGNRLPSLDKLVQISSVLEVRPSQLLAEAERLADEGGAP